MATPPNDLKPLKAEWDRLQPIALENERRLWQKLRLEWNYHSNHIEGNTLTYGETVLLLLHGQTHGNHTLREYEEMKAHDVGIEHLRNLAADAERLIGPGDIRDLNRIILKEPFWKPTQTPDGLATRAEVIPGEYKTLPNSVITASGELFEYTAPMEVPAKMQALVDWLGTVLEQPDPPILQVAAKLHHDFVLIHPFDDGNGRVARMLVNYLFLRYGYPPIVIPTEEKAAYLTALRLADAGDLAPLADLFARHLKRSLTLAIRAGKGESIEEPSDIEKQVAIFVREQQAIEGGGREDREVILSIMETSLRPFVESLEAKLKTLEPLFARLHVRIQDGLGSVVVGRGGVPYENLRYVGPGQKLFVSFDFSGYRGKATSPFDHETVIGLHFPPENYTITQDGNVILSKSYSEPVLSEEIDRLTARILEKTFGVIRGKAGPRE